MLSSVLRHKFHVTTTDWCMEQNFDVLIFYSGMILTRAILNTLRERGGNLLKITLVSPLPSDRGKKLSVDISGEILPVLPVSEIAGYYDFSIILSESKTMIEAVEALKSKISIFIDAFSGSKKIFQAKEMAVSIPNLGLDKSIGSEIISISCPHYASIQLATVVAAVQMYSQLKSLRATVLCPASEYDRAGVDNLQNSTKRFFMPREVMGEAHDLERLAFNCLPSIGEHLLSGCTSVESRINSELTSLFDAKFDVSCFCVGVPVCIGSSAVVAIEFANIMENDELQKTMMSKSRSLVEIAHPAQDGTEYYTPIDVVNSDRVSVARIKKTYGNSYELWTCADNIQITAINIADILFACIANGKI